VVPHKKNSDLTTRTEDAQEIVNSYPFQKTISKLICLAYMLSVK
jgi:hypothetical protein